VGSGDTGDSGDSGESLGRAVGSLGTLGRQWGLWGVDGWRDLESPLAAGTTVLKYLQVAKELLYR
jgi:hypothetical protein